MIEITKLNLSFQNETIFENFNTLIKKGEKVALSGASGKGKSCLLNLLAGFIPEYEGVIRIFGKTLSPDTVSEIRKLTAWLPQDISFKTEHAKELFYAPFTFNFNKRNKPSLNEIAEIFDLFGLPKNILSKKTREISGGQKQRLLLASCLLLKRPLILLDEPTSALDEAIKQKIIDYILSEKEQTVIAATHDEYLIEHSSKVIHL